jgi:NAD(P)-dependent dehydrogenase (short-subunit alcohol dehydrogenase family)
MTTAIITGASMGLGRALTRTLHELGWTLVVDGRDRDRLRTLVGELGPDRLVAIPGDVTDPAHRRALVDAAEAVGGLDLLVNNASTLGPTPMPALADYPLDAWRAVYETNVVAPLALVQAALPSLLASRGTVVNITSDAGIEGYEGWGGYGSSKAALEQLGRVLAAEHPDLSVYTVDPGDMRTQMHQDAFPGEDISDRPEPETSVPGLLTLILGQLPSGRYIARDVATTRPVAPEVPR